MNSSEIWFRSRVVNGNDIRNRKEVALMASNAMKKAEQKGLSMVDLAFEILKTEKQPLPLQELMNRVKEAKQIPKDQVEEKMARFYTILNLDGRFIFIGENHWGLKGWYPFDQTKEDIEIPKPKRKRKKKKKKVEEEEDYADGFDDDDYTDEEDDLDDYDEDEDFEDEDEEEGEEDDDEDED